jgi:hypothetical protein
MMMPVRNPFSALAPENKPLFRENQYNYIRFDSLNPSFHYPRTHDSNIPELQHSNWCKAPNLGNEIGLLNTLQRRSSIQKRKKPVKPVAIKKFFRMSTGKNY